MVEESGGRWWQFVEATGRVANMSVGKYVVESQRPKIKPLWLGPRFTMLIVVMVFLTQTVDPIGGGCGHHIYKLKQQEGGLGLK